MNTDEFIEYRWFKVYRMRCVDDTYTSFFLEGHDILEHFEGWVRNDNELMFEDGISQEEYERLVFFVDNVDPGASLEIYQWVVVFCGDEQR